MGQALWAVGAVINVAGSIFINFGTNVMKLGHNKRDLSPLPEEDRPPIRVYREWQVGIALFALGNILNFVSFGFAAQSLLAALGSVQFISNVIFASLVLHEQVTKKILGGTALIVVGCILLVSFGNHDSKILTVHDMIADFKSTPYIVYLVLLTCSIAIMYTTYRVGKRKLRAVGHERLSGWWVRMLPISYAMFSGMLGTQSVLFCKMLSMLLRTTIQGHSQLASWFTWLIFFLFLGTAFFWVSRLNKALKQFPAIMIVPTMQISWTLFSIIGGGIYFQEYRTFTPLSASMFGLGVVVVFAGVFMLTPSKRAYLRHYKDLEDKRLMVQPRSDTGDLELNGSSNLGNGSAYSPEDTGRFSSKEHAKAGAADIEKGVVQRMAAPRKGLDTDLRGAFEKAKIGTLRIRTSQLSPRETARHSATGDRWEDIVMSPLSTVDDSEIQPAPEQPTPAAPPPNEPPHSLLQDLREDFSMDVGDNYRRMLGLEGTGQVPAVSVMGMPFDCYYDREQSKSWSDAPVQTPSTSGPTPTTGGPTPSTSGNPAQPSMHDATSTGEGAGTAPTSHFGFPSPFRQPTSLQTGPGPPRGGGLPGYQASDGASGNPFRDPYGGMLSLQQSEAATEAATALRPSSNGEGPSAAGPNLQDAPAYASDVSSPWMSPASSAGIGSPPDGNRKDPPPP